MQELSTAAEAADVQRARLIEIISAKSLLRQTEVKLVSGGTSSFYFDMKLTAYDPEGANLIAELILAAIGSERYDYVGGLEMGAVPIVACVAEKSFPDHPLPGFSVRKQPKAHGTRRMIEGIGSDQSLAGKRVVLVEDVTTTGGSVLKAADIVRAEGAIVAKVITVVDRCEGATETFADRGIAFVPILTARDFVL